MFEKILNLLIKYFGKKKRQKQEYSEKDYEFMGSISAAILEQSPSKINNVLKFWIITIFAFIIWASFTSIEEITRGNGEAIPDGSNQVIQNLEGGIVNEILIREGDLVKKDDIILKIVNTKASSEFEASKSKIKELEAKSYRLRAEAYETPFEAPQIDDPEFGFLIENEKSLYLTDMVEFRAKDSSTVAQIEQKKSEYIEIEQKIKSLQYSVDIISEEIAMIRPMVEQGVKSKVDFLKMQREANDIDQQLKSAQIMLPKQESMIEEFRKKRIENRLVFQNEAKKELNEALAEINRIKATELALSDSVNRTVIKAPVDGIVQKLHIHTIGGVIKPGDPLAELVPSDSNLLFEIKIQPKDIAFISFGARAMVKVSAYDFAIHGGLDGKVVAISPDTITDEKDETFYLIRVKTEKNHLGTVEKPLKIIPGMVADVDIVTGEKTIMQYLLKPILKSKEYMFTEK
jgi:membrane fusion protein, adhesin transport system